MSDTSTSIQIADLMEALTEANQRILVAEMGQRAAQALASERLERINELRERAQRAESLVDSMQKTLNPQVKEQTIADLKDLKPLPRAKAHDPWFGKSFQDVYANMVQGKPVSGPIPSPDDPTQ
jgi:hypothetical protein